MREEEGKEGAAQLLGQSEESRHRSGEDLGTILFGNVDLGYVEGFVFLLVIVRRLGDDHSGIGGAELVAFSEVGGKAELPIQKGKFSTTSIKKRKRETGSKETDRRKGKIRTLLPGRKTSRCLFA
jgi:hypothetical protein